MLASHVTLVVKVLPVRGMLQTGAATIAVPLAA